MRERGFDSLALGIKRLTTGYRSRLPWLDQDPACTVIDTCDLDCPGLGERIEVLFDEVTGLFGAETDGIVAELEFCDGEAPHRVPLYDAWAAANRRPDFAAIKNFRHEPRGYPFAHWRDSPPPGASRCWRGSSASCAAGASAVRLRRSWSSTTRPPRCWATGTSRSSGACRSKTRGASSPTSPGS